MSKNFENDYIVFVIPFGYQFLEEARWELNLLNAVPFERLVEVVVSGYVYCLCYNVWPDEHYDYFYEDFVFEEYLPSLSDMDSDIEGIQEEIERARNELSDLTVNLHYHNCRRNGYIEAIFQQPAFYYVERIASFGRHKKHLQVFLALEPYEDEDD